jgi:Tfp pilus assembly major pilin PilA
MKRPQGKPAISRQDAASNCSQLLRTKSFNTLTLPMTSRDSNDENDESDGVSWFCL